MTVSRVLILGGYGNFGKRIVQQLADIAKITLIVAGRNHAKAQLLCRALLEQGVQAGLEAAAVNVDHRGFAHRLRALRPDLLIHTAGPFQGQNYRVPLACIDVGCHYIDLADDRRFVSNIGNLNSQAREKNVLVVSGASSVPGLSSVVVEHYLSCFARLEEIDTAIVPGNRAERGEATVRGILSYTGHAYPVFFGGCWRDMRGWMSPRRRNFGEVLGKRWLANVDVPDLQLFPQRYQPVQTVSFQAGLEVPLLHLGMVAMAYLAKWGWVKDWSKWTGPITRFSTLFDRCGSDIGGMQMRLVGQDSYGGRKMLEWTLLAKHGVGPYIPTLSAIILAKKIIMGSLPKTGAYPCLGLYTMDEFDEEAAKLGIVYHLSESGG